MSENDNILKKELCDKLIENGLVEEYDVVKHSYTQQILNGNKKCVEKNDGCMITLTTRGDCVGVVVSDRNNKPKVIGGIGEKKSNGAHNFINKIGYTKTMLLYPLQQTLILITRWMVGVI